MKLINLIFLLLCLIEIYAQRSRTTNNNQDAITEEPRTVRGRGRTRFSAVQEQSTSERPSTNRRASTRTRIHSNNPKAAANRRARPTEAPNLYPIEEINNDSPIESFRRESKPRVLTESRFDIPTVTVATPRRPISRAYSVAPVSEALPAEDFRFGITARAILQARGEILPPRTTTPVIDETYLLNNFGNTIRTIAAQRNEAPIQRATPLRSEVPILDKDDFVPRRGSLRGDSLPSLKNSEVTIDSQVPTRGRKNSARASTEQSRYSSRADIQRRTTEAPIIEEIPIEEPESDFPEAVEGLNDQPDVITETQPIELSTETVLVEEEELKKIQNFDDTTQRTSENTVTRRVAGNNNRNTGRRRTETVEQYEYTPVSRTRSRTRTSQAPEEARPTASTRTRGSRRKYDDAAVAESRSRGPSVFTAEQYQDVTSRSRTGRRIDSRIERVPQRVTIDIPSSTTVKPRSPGRRASTTESTFAARERIVDRGRNRSASPENTSRPVRRPTNNRRHSSAEEKPIHRADVRRGTKSRFDDIETRPALSKENSETANRRNGNSRFSRVDNRMENIKKAEYAQNKISEEILPYGERSPKIKNLPQQTTTEEIVTVPIERSRSSLPEVPPRIDESKLEVLPLFEREAKTVPYTRLRGQKPRASSSTRTNLRDPMHVSATENDVKFVEKPTTSAFTRVTVTRTESVESSTSRARLGTRTSSTSPSTTTTEQPTTTRPDIKTRAAPIIRESVVAEVNEVTSKSTIMRRQKVSKAKAAEIIARGNKKAEIKLSDIGKKKSLSEEIDEEDNYPEAFKALLQAKKQKEESRPSQSSTRNSSPVTSTSTEKVFVTSAASPRGSSTTRIVTTESLGSRRRSKLTNEIINENENELDPKPTISSTSPEPPTRKIFKEKPKYAQKPREKYNKYVTSKPKFEKPTAKTTSAPRKSFSPKTYPPRPSGEHSRRKALRSTASPPSTTPLTPIANQSKFSAKFMKKEVISEESDNSGSQQPTGLYSSKKDVTDEEVKSDKKLIVSVAQAPKPSIPIKKFNASKYSSRYRSDTSQRSSLLKTTTPAPFYTPTIPTPAYVPTVPTMTPSTSTEEGFVVKKDSDLGLEVISFDDPVNTIPSADLVNGEYLATDKNFRLSSTVKDGTTEKPVSIIERIINSITSISTTEAPNTVSTDSPSPTNAGTSENSAILKLAPKKTNAKDKTLTDEPTNIIETITSEKPTTIIEKIRSSLSAIQNNEVGTSDYNTVSSSTTPLSTVTKYSAKFRGSSVGTTALPAPQPLSTSINPLNVFDEIQDNQVLEKRTIGKLLNILNGLVSTSSPPDSEKLVVVTPKSVLNSRTGTSGFVATTFSPQEPLEAITLNSIDFSTSSALESTDPSSIVNTESTTSSTIVNTESSSLSSTESTESSTLRDTTSSVTSEPNTEDRMGTATTADSTATDGVSTENSSTLKTDISTESVDMTTVNSLESSSVLTLEDISTQSSSTSLDFTTSTVELIETTTSSDTSNTTSIPSVTTYVDGSSSSTFYTIPSTLPTIPNIEVSPEMVSIYSANDLSNFITPEDHLFNTVTIASRIGFDNNVLTTTTTTEGTTSTTMESTTSTESATVVTTTEVTDMTTSAVNSTTATESSTTSTSAMVDTTTMLTTTMLEESTTLLATTMSPNTTMASNTSSSNNSGETISVSNRSGRILSNDIGEPVGNSIEVSTSSTTTSTTPDYFVFAVLNNNTILRKRPPTIPNKDTPFIIVGLYPNNTVVRKFPNGTLVPMEQIIKVESNRMGRLLETKQTPPSPPPRVVVDSTTSSTTTSTTTVSSTTSTTTTSEPNVMSTTTNSPTTMSSALMSSTSEILAPSTTSSGTTSTTSLPSTSTTTMVTNVVRIMSVPGETRISKAQTTTEPSTTLLSNEQSSTTQSSTSSTSTTAQSTETIPSTLGEILNGKTVSALNNLLENVETASTKPPSTEVSQNSITSTTAQSSTQELSTENDAPFTSPNLVPESTTQFLSSSDRLVSSTLISALMPVTTTTQEPTTTTTRRVTITSTTEPSTTTTTTMQPTTTEATTTTQRIETTTRKLIMSDPPRVKSTAAPRTTTGFPTFMPSTILPSILTTLFPNLMRGALTTPKNPLSSTRRGLTSADLHNGIGDRFEVLSIAGSTARPTTVLPPSTTSQKTSSTTPLPTTSTASSTTVKQESTTIKTAATGTPLPTTKEETDALFEQLKKSGKLKNLSEEQRKNLEEIEKIEREQAELLKQLTLLTTMFGGQAGKVPNLPTRSSGNPFGGNSQSLANRIIAMAMERDKSRPSTSAPSTTTTSAPKSTTKRPNSIQDKLPTAQTETVTQKTTPSLEDVLKQYNLKGLSTPTPLTSTYGKTDEALLAAILKEQGIGPTTPKVLADKVKEAGLFEENPTTKAPKPKPRPRATTTARPLGGRLMQGLNWLIDILDPPTTKRPATRKPKAQPRPQPANQNSGDEELLAKQPTRITPMVTAAPVTRPNLSQDEIQSLIKQLEAVQRDPTATDQLDFSKIKNLENLLNVNEGVQVTSAGQHGATSRATPRPPRIQSTSEKDPFLTEINKKVRSSTVSTLSVSNSIEDDDVQLISTTTRTRPLPPVSLNPIPGIDNQGDSLIRSNLLTAAVNVTRAISSFLGSALQGATRGFRSLMTSGSSVVGNVAKTSSAGAG